MNSVYNNLDNKKKTSLSLLENLNSSFGIASYLYHHNIIGSQNIVVQHPICLFLKRMGLNIAAGSRSIGTFCLNVPYLYSAVSRTFYCDFGTMQYPYIFQFAKNFENYAYPFLDADL